MDIDDDGVEDILSGSWQGDIHWFRGTARRAYGKPAVLYEAQKRPEDKSGYTLLQSSSVAAVDWDGDKDIDLVVGNIHGEVMLLTNEGTRAEARFGEPKPVVVAGTPLVVRGRKAGVCIADWDKDGTMDLVVGSESSEVIWCRNSYDIGLAKPEVLVSGDPQYKTGYRAKPCVADWNDDGWPDLLVGNCESDGKGSETHGYVYLRLRKP